MVADGGGLVPAALQPIEGGEVIAHYLVELAERAAGQLALVERTVNGQPGLVGTQDGVTATVFAFDIVDDRIRRVSAVRNPEKLGPGRPADGRSAAGALNGGRARFPQLVARARR